MHTYSLEEAKKRLFHLLDTQALSRGKVILSSGKESNYYLDGRLVTLCAEGAYLAARLILDLVKDKEIDAIGGPTLGADPLVGAIGVLSYLEKKPVNTFIVRKAPKAHGKMRQIEGPRLKMGSRVVLIDDVATTGKALIEAKQVLDGEGIEADTAIVVIDRQEGAEKNLSPHGLKLVSLFKARDFGV
ncbi:MAG: orotate phosphoribosyltransferase [Candidatus Omnitrophota bacterium]